MAILSKSNISADRIVYVGKDTGESRTYVSESKELVELFFEKYNIQPNSIVMSDNGNAFIPSKDGNRESPLTSAGFNTLKQYPAAVHQFLSPTTTDTTGWRSKSGGIQALTERMMWSLVLGYCTT